MTRRRPDVHARLRRGAVVVELAEIPGTGYRWDLVDPRPGVAVTRSSFEDASAPGTVGGGGVRRLTIKVPDGVGRVALGLSRSWEPHPIEILDVVVERGA